MLRFTPFLLYGSTVLCKRSLVQADLGQDELEKQAATLRHMEAFYHETRSKIAVTKRYTCGVTDCPAMPSQHFEGPHVLPVWMPGR